MAHKVKALQQWCKVRCEGYRDVAITNFTSSWKSGLAFCAIIHRYRPDLIDYDSLKKEDTYGNSKKAFDVALSELGIAALLDPEDMVAMAVPDKLCIITYVAQYYNYFHNKDMLGGPGVKAAVKRSIRMTDVLPSPEPKKNLAEISNKPAVVPTDGQVSPAAKRRTIEDRCCMCQQKVYLLERHYSGGKLYHRHCCREAERSSTLRLNKENYGPPGDKKDSLLGGRSTTTDTNKTQPQFGGTNSSVKVDSVAPAVSKPSTGLLTSLHVPSKYPSSGTSGVSWEASKVTADLPKTVPTTSSGASAQPSAFVPKTTTPSRGIWGLTATTTSSNVSGLGASNYSTAASKSSSPGITTTATAKAVPTTSSGASAQPSAFVPKTTTPSRGIWGLTATTTSSNLSGLGASNYSTAASKSPSPGITTTATAKVSTPVITTSTIKAATPTINTAGTVKSTTPGITITLKSATPGVNSTVKSSTPGITTTTTAKLPAPGVAYGTVKSLAPVATANTVKTPTQETTVTLKSTTPDTSKVGFSKWFGSKNSAQPSKDTVTVNTTKTTITIPATISSPNPTSALSSGSKWTPGAVSTAVTSNSSASKYTGIFSSRTTPAAASATTGTTTAAPSAGYISTITTTVSGQVPSCQTGFKDVAFTFRVGNSSNTSTTVSSALPGTVSSTSETSNKSTFPAAKSPTGLGSVGIGATDAVKSGKDVSPKAEWQLEAERRQKIRNGAYVDPEKYPQRNNGPGVILSGPTVESERVGGKKEIETKKETEKTNAKQSLVNILQKQLNTKGEPRKISDAVMEEVPPPLPRSEVPKSPETQTHRTEAWVIVERPDYDNTRPGISRSPPFRIPDTEIVLAEACPLSPPEAWKKVVMEGKIGFLNTDETTELARRHSFESSPNTFTKRAHVVRNPSVPKRKVNAEQKVSVDQINRKLVTLDQQLRVVEAKGRQLEDKIRGGTDDAMDEDEEEVMIEWFALVKQKYELVREESDLMYRRRQQELEELHEELEYQFRCLNIKPDDEKTYDEREYEKQLLKEIFEVVNLRDNIVNAIEVDRQRYLEEDERINSMMEASGIGNTGSGKKKHKKNKKKPRNEKRKTFLGFRRSSSMKSPAAKDVE